MTWRSRFLVPAAIVFALINLFGGIIAVAGGESLHAATHAVLLLLIMPFLWSRLPDRYANRAWPSGEVESAIPPKLFGDRLANLEQSVDAVAVELERIGEGQRFMTNFFADRARAPVAGSPNESTAPQSKPLVTPPEPGEPGERGG